MIKRLIITYAALTTGLVLASMPLAKADTAKFYSGDLGYTGLFNGVGTVYDTTKALPTNCPGGGSACAGGPDIILTTQTFTTSVPIMATTPTIASPVWNDLSPNFGGLGVGSLAQGDTADQISGTDLLHLHFASAVTLTGVATLFDAGHTPFGTGFPDNSTITGANGFLLNGVLTTFGAANMAALALVGTDFNFQQAAGQPAFYVSGLSYNVNQVPLPGAVWLFGSALIGLGVLGRKRKLENDPMRRSGL